MALSSEAAANRSNPRSATLPQPLTPRVKRPRGKTPFSAELLNRNSAARLFGDALAPLVVRAGHFLDGVVGHTPTMPHAPTVGKRGSSDAYVESRKGAVTHPRAAFRFPSPLIKPDGPISSIRLSDRPHQLAHGGDPQCHVHQT